MVCKLAKKVFTVNFYYSIFGPRQLNSCDPEANLERLSHLDANQSVMSRRDQELADAGTPRPLRNLASAVFRGVFNEGVVSGVFLSAAAVFHSNPQPIVIHGDSTEVCARLAVSASKIAYDYSPTVLEGLTRGAKVVAHVAKQCGTSPLVDRITLFTLDAYTAGLEYAPQIATAMTVASVVGAIWGYNRINKQQENAREELVDNLKREYKEMGTALKRKLTSAEADESAEKKALIREMANNLSERLPEIRAKLSTVRHLTSENVTEILIPLERSVREVVNPS